jgi:hypothetical protein
MNNRKFILAECLDGQHHLVAIDQIRNISPTQGKDKLISKIVLLDGDTNLYSSEKPNALHNKIIKALENERQ